MPLGGRHEALAESAVVSGCLHSLAKSVETHSRGLAVQPNLA